MVVMPLLGEVGNLVSSPTLCPSNKLIVSFARNKNTFLPDVSLATYLAPVPFLPPAPPASHEELGRPTDLWGQVFELVTQGVPAQTL